MASESKFTKSRSNAGTEREGLSLLLTDPRFQVPNLATKRRILELIGTTQAFGIQTFDAVMTAEAVAMKLTILTPLCRSRTISLNDPGSNTRRS